MYHGEQFTTYINIEACCFTPETNILYVSYTSILKKATCGNDGEAVAPERCEEAESTRLSAHSGEM